MADSGGFGSFGDILKKAQDLQERLSRAQEELRKKTVEASAGGGMVTVVMNGKLEVVSVSVDPSVVDSRDREMLQDLVLAAVNEAIRRTQQMVAEEMSRVTGGLPIPGLGGS